MKNVTITTQHTEIGYTNNVKIIAEALRAHLGVQDNSHVETAVAAHIWSYICGRGCGVDRNSKTWGTEEIAQAIRTVQYRVSVFEKAIA
jgi:hypothetical protein